MSKYIVGSPILQYLKYPVGTMAEKVSDAHKLGKLYKLILGPHDLIDDSKLPIKGNWKFTDDQYEAADIVIFIDKDKNRITIKGAELCVEE